jgi:hypothetical protein
MMKLEVTEHIDARQWDEHICSVGGNICHSSSRADYVLANDPNTTVRFLSLLSDTGELIGAAVGFQSRSPRKMLAPFTGRFWLDSLPAVRLDVEDALMTFLQQLEDYARSGGIIELDIGSSATGAGAVELETLGFDLTRRMEFELNLDLSEDELLKGMEYKRRKNINKAKRLGVLIEEMSDEEGIAELRRLQGHSSERIVARGGRDITHKHQSSRDPVQVLLDSGLGRIVVARVNDEIVSAGLFTHFNHLVYHTLSGHSAEALKSQAPTFLIWDTILRYKQEGARRFNFGGCKISAVNEGDPEHGVYVYKKAFGAECIECASGHKILKKTTQAVLRRLKRWLQR